MRILSISLGLAAVAFVAAQVDQLAANGPQSTYEWVGDSDLEKTLAIQKEVFSEPRIRAVFLKSFQVPDFQAEDCENVFIAVTKTLNEVAGSLNAVPSSIPGVNAIVDTLRKFLNQVLDMVAGVSANLTFVSLELAIGTIQSTLAALSVGPAGFVLKPVSELMNGAGPTLKELFSCQQGKGVDRLAIYDSQCDSLADLYRSTLEDSVENSASLSLPADASEELRRFFIGSLALLDLLSKTSIANTNDALLETRSIFAGDLLQECRAALLHLSPPEDIRNFADISLGSVVSFSNSLEACLRVAADPLGDFEDYDGSSNAEADENEDEDDE